MIIGVGIDLCEIGRMEALLYEERFLAHYFAQEEQEYIHDRGRMASASMAGIFAAKEALVKALGTGFTDTQLSDIRVKHDACGAPYFDLTGGIAVHVSQRGITSLYLSITHEGNMAAAVVIAERNI